MEYWMKHFGATGPVGTVEEGLANQLRALDQQNAAIMAERQRIYGEIRSHRRKARESKTAVA